MRCPKCTVHPFTSSIKLVTSHNTLQVTLIHKFPACILFTLHLYALDVLRTVYEPIPELYIYIVNNLSLLCACPITIIIISITMHAYTIG